MVTIAATRSTGRRFSVLAALVAALVASALPLLSTRPADAKPKPHGAYRADVEASGSLIKGDSGPLVRVSATGAFHQSGNAWRLDIAVTAGQMSESTTVIFNPDAGAFYVLHPDTLTGASYTKDEMMKRAKEKWGALDPTQAIAGAADLARQPGAKKLGRRIIGGLACKGYRLKSGDASLTVWMHEGLLIPVEMESRSGGSILEFRAKNVDAGASIPKDEFTVPKEYSVSAYRADGAEGGKR
jgi:hypothetical protein